MSFTNAYAEDKNDTCLHTLAQDDKVLIDNLYDVEWLAKDTYKYVISSK